MLIAVCCTTSPLCTGACVAVVQDRFTQYTTKLRQEITSQEHINKEPLKTVFFGGGTPSLIPPHHLEGILETLHEHVGIAPDAEISMEADPGTFDLVRLQEYMKLGVTRFSVGVQSFNEVCVHVCARMLALAAQQITAIGCASRYLYLYPCLCLCSSASGFVFRQCYKSVGGLMPFRTCMKPSLPCMQRNRNLGALTSSRDCLE